jgi:hypothetical protein
MSLTGAFTRHPAAVGESYGEHLAFATGFGGRMVLAGLACILHGFLPFLFVRTGSRAVLELHDRMSDGARGRLHPVVAEAAQPAN